jgi:hypothetical protein
MNVSSYLTGKEEAMAAAKANGADARRTAMSLDVFDENSIA